MNINLYIFIYYIIINRYIIFLRLFLEILFKVEKSLTVKTLTTFLIYSIDFMNNAKSLLCLKAFNDFQ